MLLKMEKSSGSIILQPSFPAVKMKEKSLAMVKDLIPKSWTFFSNFMVPSRFTLSNSPSMVETNKFLFR